MTVVTADSDVRQVPRAGLIAPAGLEPSTPPHELMGISLDLTPSHVVQARDLALRFPHSVVAQARLAQAEQSAGGDAAAAEAARMALSLEDGGHAPARVAAAAILARFSPGDASAALATIDDPIAKLNWATEAAVRGDYKTAIDRLSGVELASAYAVRGFCLTNIGDHRAAIREFRRARDAGRNSVDVLINMGYAFAHLDSIEKAVHFTQQAVHASPINSTASYNLTRYLIRSGQRQRATAELDRLSAARPWDGRSLLYRAWAHVGTTNETRDAIDILSASRGRFSASNDPMIRAEIDASIDFLRFQVGALKVDKAIERLARVASESGKNSSQVISMYVELLNEAQDASGLESVIESSGDVLHEPELRLARSKLALLRGDVHRATSEAVAASLVDESNDYGTASAVAYLVGEVNGDYARGAELAQGPFNMLPNVHTGNNLAFCLALSGRPHDAYTVLSQFSDEELPYFGATLGLAHLSSGRVADGIEKYRAAEEAMRRAGNAELADCIFVRAGLALRQLNIDHPWASSDAIQERWQVGSKRSRWTVMACVASRVGVIVPAL